MKKIIVLMSAILVICFCYYWPVDFYNKDKSYLKENYVLNKSNINKKSYNVREENGIRIAEVTGLVSNNNEFKINKNDINEFDIEKMKLEDIDNIELREFYEIGIYNTNILQTAINDIANNGGGKVIIPSGTFYFTANKGRIIGVPYYIIKCRDNVLIEGTGMDKTILKPFGVFPHGVNMFVHLESNKNGKVYIENADFKHFTIDGELTSVSKKYYAGGGKGFMMAPIKDCDWEFVKVMNTDATGFGVDLPVNSTIKNCIAIGNGKAADETKNGASGFGIGTGYADDESMYIKDCLSIGNRKYGFFFEHQGRFNSYSNKSRIAEGYNEDTSISGFVVENSIARGNMYDFGGEKGNDVTYKNCISEISKKNDPNPLGISNKSAFNFGLDTRRIHLINNHIEQNKYIDISKEYNAAIDWAINRVIISSDLTNFKANTPIKRKQAITLLWRMAERPGEVLLGSENINTSYNDIASCNWQSCSYYEAAVDWGVKNGILNNNLNKFNPDNNCSNANFILMLWRYSGSKIVNIKNGFVENETIKSWHIAALNWALSIGLIDKNFEVEKEYKKIDCIKLLYDYYNLQSKI